MLGKVQVIDIGIPKAAQDAVTERVGVPLGKMLERLGVDTFDVGQIEKRFGREKALEVQRLHNAATIRLHGDILADRSATGDY